MKHQTHVKLAQSSLRAIMLLLCTLLLAGCAVAPAEYALIDGDDSSESFAETPIVTIQPEREQEITQQSFDSTQIDEAFSILFVNVGKADAAIVRFGETAVLIDTGSAESAPQLIAGLNAMHVSQISAVFITHSHGDHLGGLDALSANYTIPMVYSAFYAEADKNGVGKIVKRAEKLNLPHIELKAGDVVPVSTDVSFTVLGPILLNTEDDNDNSLVLRFTYGGTSFLFTGDMQFPEESTLIQAGVDLKSDVLKVGNHGNPDATGDDFSALVSPNFGVISTDTTVDQNSANPRVYAALPSAQIVVTQDFPIGVLLSLDQNGAVTLQNPARGISSPLVWVYDFRTETQTITLINTGNVVSDLSGYILYSVRTDATLRFPDGTSLAAGETITIGEGGDFSFSNEDKPLSKKKDNTVILYDNFGALVSKIEE